MSKSFDVVVTLAAEVIRLHDLVDFAIAVIDSNDCYMGEEEQADLLNYLRSEKDAVFEGEEEE